MWMAKTAETEPFFLLRTSKQIRTQQTMAYKNNRSQFGTHCQAMNLVLIHIIVSLIQIIHQFNRFTIPIVNYQILWVVSFLVIAAVIGMIIKNPLEFDIPAQFPMQRKYNPIILQFVCLSLLSIHLIVSFVYAYPVVQEFAAKLSDSRDSFERKASIASFVLLACVVGIIGPSERNCDRV